VEKLDGTPVLEGPILIAKTRPRGGPPLGWQASTGSRLLQNEPRAAILLWGRWWTSLNFHSLALASRLRSQSRTNRREAPPQDHDKGSRVMGSGQGCKGSLEKGRSNSATVPSRALAHSSASSFNALSSQAGNFSFGNVAYGKARSSNSFSFYSLRFAILVNRFPIDSRSYPPFSCTANMCRAHSRQPIAHRDRHRGLLRETF